MNNREGDGARTRYPIADHFAFGTQPYFMPIAMTNPDSSPAMQPKCPICSGMKFRHMHDTAHGIAETHMAGSERFECTDCGHVVLPSHGLLGFQFVLDPPKEQR